MNVLQMHRQWTDAPNNEVHFRSTPSLHSACKPEISTIPTVLSRRAKRLLHWDDYDYQTRVPWTASGTPTNPTKSSLQLSMPSKCRLPSSVTCGDRPMTSGMGQPWSLRSFQTPYGIGNMRDSLDDRRCSTAPDVQLAKNRLTKSMQSFFRSKDEESPTRRLSSKALPYASPAKHSTALALVQSDCEASSRRRKQKGFRVRSEDHFCPQWAPNGVHSLARESTVAHQKETKKRKTRRHLKQQLRLFGPHRTRQLLPYVTQEDWRATHSAAETNFKASVRALDAVMGELAGYRKELSQISRTFSRQSRTRTKSKEVVEREAVEEEEVKIQPRIEAAPAVDATKAAREQRKAELLKSLAEVSLTSQEGQSGKLKRVYKVAQAGDKDEVNIELVPLMLKKMGHLVQDELVEAAIADMMTTHSTLSLDEWIQLHAIYRVKEKQVHMGYFKNADKDGSGSIDLAELSALLSTLGFSLSDEVLCEAIEEVFDRPGSTFNFDEFEHLLVYFWRGEGFTKRELSRLADAFVRFDLNTSGYISTDELFGILHYLGYAIGPEERQRLFDQHRKSNRGDGLDFMEFVRFVRTVHEDFVDRMEKLFTAADADGSGLCDREEFATLLTKLGHVTDDDALEEVWDAGIQQAETKDATPAEFRQIFSLYQDNDGFSSKKRKEYKRAFDKCSVGKDLKCIQVPKLLRGLGFDKTMDEVLPMIQKVDIDSSGRINFDELCKLMRDIVNNERKTAMQVYEDYADSDGARFESLENMLDALNVHHNEGGFIREIEAQQLIPVEHGNISFDAFCKSIDIVRNMEVAFYGKNAFFSKEEVAALQITFKDYAVDGQISGWRLRAFLLDLFPAACDDVDEHQMCRQLLQESDEDNSGSINFSQFLHITRRKQELKEQMVNIKEDEVIEKLSFSTQNAEEFRVFFLEECTMEDNVPSMSLMKAMNIFQKTFGTFVIEEMKTVLASRKDDEHALSEKKVQMIKRYATSQWDNREAGAMDLSFVDFLVLVRAIADIRG